MLTEDKRLEMDLEGLWKTVQKVKDMNQARIESVVADPGEITPSFDPEKSATYSNEVEGSVSGKNSSFLSRPVTIRNTQIRGFHHTTKNMFIHK